MPNATFPQIAELLQSGQRFAVMSHMRPDGDALGCTLAMALCLRDLGKEVYAWNQDGMPEKFEYLPGSEMVTLPPAEPVDIDVAIVIDTAVRNRAGTSLEGVKSARAWVNIDHHVSNEGYGDLSYIDPVAPAAGQILFEFFSSQGLPVTPAIAANLFAAISTDTGSFQYPNTTARTYEIAAELIRAGVDVGRLSQQIYESYPRRRLELLRRLLNQLEFSADGRAASFALSLADAQAIEAQPEDNEGLIDHIRGVQGVVIAAFFEELEEGKVRISLRSKDPRADVCQICAIFGGGGHILAAGARAAGSLAEVRARVLAEIDRTLAALQP